MTMYYTECRKWFFSLVCLLNASLGFSQENFTAFWQPSVAVNYDLTSTYSHNFSVQNRNFIYEDETATLNTRQVDVVHFSNLRIRENQSIALGILYRFRDVFENSSNELRLTQQYNIQNRPLSVRYGHRLRSEQRISTIRTVHRFRYRFSLDFPLKGEKLDIGEPYLVGNLENLLSVAKSLKPQYDLRLTAHIGWKLSQKTKVQIGSEYRFEDYGQNLENVFFILTNLNFSL